MKINEIETIGYSSSDADLDWINLKGDVVGKIGKYEVFRYDHRAAERFYVANPDRVEGPYRNPDDISDILIMVELTTSRDHKSAWKPNVIAHKSIRGTGLVIKLYEFLLKKMGLTLVADDMQSRGGKSVWARLAKVPGVNVYGWKKGTDEYFAWDPDDSPDEEVYTTPPEELNKRIEQLTDFKTKLEHKLKLGQVSEDDFDEMMARIEDEKQSLRDMNIKNKDLKDLTLVATAK